MCKFQFLLVLFVLQNARNCAAECIFIYMKQIKILYDYQLTSLQRGLRTSVFCGKIHLFPFFISWEVKKLRSKTQLTNRSEAEAGLSETFKIPISLNFLPVWISTGGILSDFPSAAALACPDPQIHEHARFHRRCMQIYKERFPNTWKCKKHLPTSKNYFSLT